LTSGKDSALAGVFFFIASILRNLSDGHFQSRIEPGVCRDDISHRLDRVRRKIMGRFILALYPQGNF
jgi:hypothetical protein